MKALPSGGMNPEAWLALQNFLGSGWGRPSHIPASNFSCAWLFPFSSIVSSTVLLGFPCGSAVKNLPAMQEIPVQSLGREDTLEEGMATHSSILAWRIPWTEEPGGLWSMWLQRVRRNWSNWARTHFLTRVFLRNHLHWIHHLRTFFWGTQLS